jgi:hypothetical protein
VNDAVLQLTVTANVVPNSLIPFTVMMAVPSSETSVLTRARRCHITEDDILHSHRREILKSYLALTGWTLQWRRNVFPVRYDLGFYIPEDGIIHNHSRENLSSDKDLYLNKIPTRRFPSMSCTIKLPFPANRHVFFHGLNPCNN